LSDLPSEPWGNSLESFLGMSRSRLTAPLEEAYRSVGGRGYPLRLSGLPGDIYLSVSLDATVVACLNSAGLLDEAGRRKAIELISSQTDRVGDDLAWESGTEGINGWSTVLSCFAYKRLGAEVDAGAVRWMAAMQNRDGGFGYNPGEPSAAIYTFYALKGLRHRFEPRVTRAAEGYLWAVARDRSAGWFERALALGALPAKDRASDGVLVAQILAEFREGVRSDPDWITESEIYRSSTGHLIRGLRWAMLPVLLLLGGELTEEMKTTLDLVVHWLTHESWPTAYRSSYTERNLPESFTYALALSTIAACLPYVPRPTRSLRPRPVLSVTPIDQVAGRTRYAILTMREDEYRAIASRFSNRKIVVGGANTYEYCPLGPEGSSAGVMLGRCVEQGPAAAQAVTGRLLSDCNPDWLLLVGIAGALPSEEVCLGDVVLASRLSDYSISAAVEKGGREIELRGGPMHRDVENLLSLVTTLDRSLSWSSAEAVGSERPSESEVAIDDTSRYYGDPRWQASVRRALIAAFGPESQRSSPISTARVVASGGTLVKDTKLAKEWRQASRSIAAVEMELSGVYEAIRSQGSTTRLIAVRGISDIVGYRRDATWVEYACRTAASYAVSLIESGLLEDLASGNSSVSRPN